ncbi:hypothetical protein WDZ92_33065 [Nostoc sp. NIES-2111]
MLPPDFVHSQLRYMEHLGGDQLTIYHFGLSDWSKALRDKKVSGTKMLDAVAARIRALFPQGRFLWMANKDAPNSLFADVPGTQRLPNAPHGLNTFQTFQHVVILSALNPSPSAFGLMNELGVSSDVLKTATYRHPVYQAVMRGALRDPTNTDPKSVVVMDRPTAEWLSGLFPGSTVIQLDGLPPDMTTPKKRGRPKKHANPAARVRACRDKKKLLADLEALRLSSVESAL